MEVVRAAECSFPYFLYFLHPRTFVEGRYERKIFSFTCDGSKSVARSLDFSFWMTLERASFSRVGMVTFEFSHLEQLWMMALASTSTFCFNPDMLGSKFDSSLNRFNVELKLSMKEFKFVTSIPVPVDFKISRSLNRSRMVWEDIISIPLQHKS